MNVYFDLNKKEIFIIYKLYLTVNIQSRLLLYKYWINKTHLSNNTLLYFEVSQSKNVYTHSRIKNLLVFFKKYIWNTYIQKILQIRIIKQHLNNSKWIFYEKKSFILVGFYFFDRFPHLLYFICTPKLDLCL